jgi:hypothetical protein
MDLGGGEEGSVNVGPLRANFKRLVNKNSIKLIIKSRIGGTPQAIFPDSLDPP